MIQELLLISCIDLLTGWALVRMVRGVLSDVRTLKFQVNLTRPLVWPREGESLSFHVTMGWRLPVTFSLSRALVQGISHIKA
jgi:hypothetical protein